MIRESGKRLSLGASVQEHSVLFVDDEVNILKALQRLLRSEPVEVLTASKPSEAFELIERYQPQVIVTDQRMPEMSGVDFLKSVREQNSDIIRMMMTGFTDILNILPSREEALSSLTIDVNSGSTRSES